MVRAAGLPMSTTHPLFLLREGRLVRQLGERDWRPFTRGPDESLERIKTAPRGEATVYLYDVDGVEAHAPNLSFYQRLERFQVPLWIHAGCKTPEDAMDVFFAGAESLTVDLASVGEAGLRELSDLAEGELHLGVGMRGRALVPAVRPFDLHRLAQETGIAGIVLDPEPGVDLHHAASLAGELRRHGLPITILLRRLPEARVLAGETDRIAEMP